MADDNRARAPRFSDQIAQRPVSAESDPLAALARLIGQTDPFASIGENDPASAQPPLGRQPVAPMPVQPATQRAPRASIVDPAIRGETAWPQQQPAAAQPQSAALPSWMARRGAEQQPAPAAPQRAAPEPDAYDYAAEPGAHDPYAEADAYHAEDAGEGAYDEAYAAAPPPNEKARGLAVAVMVAAFAVVGTAGAYAYRNVVGGTLNSGPPPVIKADPSPIKVVPPSQGADSGKQIVDRVASGAAERIVPREEQPVDVKEAAKGAPRVVFPGAPPIQPGAPAPQQLAPAQPSSASAPVGAEPKKIKTIQIKSDLDAARAAAPAAATPANAQASAQAAARSVATQTVRPAANNAAAVPSRNAPLSLAPQANAPAEPVRTAALPPASGTGNYHVQVSSQRSEADARTSYRVLQTKYGSLLGSRSPTIRRADLGDKGTYYRALVGPFSPDEAVEFCNSLKAAGGPCVIQRN